VRNGGWSKAGERRAEVGSRGKVPVRFDDSLRTVLAADTGSAFGAQSAFRQLVDLIGRRRVPAEGEPLARLRSLRDTVPVAVRAAAARALALADPPAELVAVFAEDLPAVAAPVLRGARLRDGDWSALLPRIGPAGRAVLRHRDGLSPAVRRGLEAFGPTDFTLAHDAAEPVTDPAPIAHRDPTNAATRPAAQQAHGGGTFAIADLVERIETFHRHQDRRPAPVPTRIARLIFETDSSGTITWTDGPRAGLVGMTVAALGRGQTAMRLDGGELAGEWTVAAVPRFAPGNGRLLGYRGDARRTSAIDADAIEPEAMRRLVHELRTPTNAISGFAELIATGLLGPVAPPYRTRAEAIGRDVQALIGAIDDLDISARVDGGALQLSPRAVDLAAALRAAVRSAVPDDRLRVVVESGIAVLADDRALDRLLARLARLAAEAAPPGTQLTVTARTGIDGVAVAWPWATPANEGSLLGDEFAMRLVHKLARALGGRLVVEPARLTLHLPSSFNAPVQATTQ
jgi:signal transduction histidine kinase